MLCKGGILVNDGSGGAYCNEFTIYKLRGQKFVKIMKAEQKEENLFYEYRRKKIGKKSKMVKKRISGDRCWELFGSWKKYEHIKLWNVGGIRYFENKR